MVGKKKGKKGKRKKKEKVILDEYKLRRELREQAKKMKPTVEKAAISIVEPQFAEDIRIGGIEGLVCHP